MDMAIVEFVMANPGSACGKIAAYVGQTPKAVGYRLRKLVALGTLTMTGTRKGARYNAARVAE